MKTAAERKRDERQRMRAKGLVLMQFWVHPEDRAQVKLYLERLQQEREKRLIVDQDSG